MFIKLSNISKTFKLNPLFEEISFTFGHKDKVGVIGRNGTGKTTLLKIVSGFVLPDNGSVNIESDFAPLSFTRQLNPKDTDLTIAEYLFKQKGLLNLRKRFKAFEDGNGDFEILSEYEEKGCYQFDSSIPQILAELNLGYLKEESTLNVLSGGEKTRLRLAPLIFNKFEALLLDEPTNNLDLDSINWFEKFLKEFEGIVVMVSHDRQFLDNVANRIVEIEDQRVTEYSGNYSKYKLLKTSQIKNLENKAEVQKKHVKKIEKQIHAKLSSADYLDTKFSSANPYIMSMSGKKAKQAQILKRRLERDVEEQNIQLPTKKWNMDFEFQPKTESSNNVVELINIAKSFGKKALIKDLSLKIKRGERILIQGKNGSGKTTLLKTITGEIKVNSGSVLRGDNLEIGYFNQEDSYKSCENTVIDEFMNHWEGSKGDARTFLHKMLFKADDVFIKVSSLSPGERAKFKLATILALSPNLLILDEPTNNLDIASREQLEKALIKYTGTLIVVSHDRYFVERLRFYKTIAL